MKEFNYSITTRNDGLEAQELLKEEAFDLVICDEEMPKMNGSQLAGWMRGQTRHQDTPFILSSGKNDPELFGNLRRHNIINAYLPKPFSGNAFIQLVTMFIKK